MEEAPGTVLSFIFVVVVTFPSSSSGMGFDNKYWTMPSQEIADLTLSLEVIEAMNDSACKTTHGRRDSGYWQVLCRNVNKGVGRKRNIAVLQGIIRGGCWK